MNITIDDLITSQAKINKKRKSGNFRTKNEALQRAFKNRAWVCADCGQVHMQTEKGQKAPKTCEKCLSEMFHTCASAAERTRLSELRLLERTGYITDLQSQVTFRLDVNGQHVCRYRADFVYLDKGGKKQVEDVKGNKDFVRDDFPLKKKLFQAVTGLEINIIVR